MLKLAYNEVKDFRGGRIYMAEAEMLEVRVSRKLLFVLTVVGLVFLMVGLDLGYFQKVFGPDFTGDRVIVKWLFLFFSVICGGAIFLNSIIYLIVPPVMLRVSKDKIVFGTGMRYSPFTISAAMVERVESFTTLSNLEVNGKKETVDGGACLYFKNDPSLPSQQTTSMGIKYENYKLEISSTYADLSGPEIAARTKGILQLR